MPYNSNAALPPAVKGNLPAHAQSIFRNAFNSAWDGSCADRQDKEACANKIAWSAVQRSYRKNAAGRWVAK